MDNTADKKKRQLPPYITWKQLIIGTLVLVAACRLSGDVVSLIWRLSVPDLSGEWEGIILESYGSLRRIDTLHLAFELDRLAATGAFRGTIVASPKNYVESSTEYTGNTTELMAEWDGRSFHVGKFHTEGDERLLLSQCLQYMILTLDSGEIHVAIEKTRQTELFCDDYYFGNLRRVSR